MGRMILGSETLADGLTITQNTTTYTSSMKFDKCTGNVSIRLTTTGNMTVVVSQQCSSDNINWYDPVDGSGTALGQIADLTTTTIDKWVKPTLVLAPYIRFKFVEANAAAGTAVLKVYAQEETI